MLRAGKLKVHIVPHEFGALKIAIASGAQIVVATGTLAMGINVPCKTVVFLGASSARPPVLRSS